jgi:peptidoglycan-associated lipoprotein
MPLDESEAVNSAFNEGEASANLKGGNIYFTRCPRDKKLVMNCYIYTASKKGKGWGDAKIVDLGDSSYNYVHPYIMPDELTMYFASNMPGGFGGYDIYKATRTKKSGGFANITNLGPNVNTAGQEVFPTMRGDSVLYFSSDGWPGMGSLDLFRSRLKNGEFQLAENLMYPLNSNGDDISIIFDPTEAIDPLSKSPYIEKGYLSSNRDGGRGGDDIYYFVLRPLVYTLAGYVRDDATLQYLDGVTVEIVGSDGTSYKTTTDVKGYYFFDKTKILGNTTYTIKVTKTKYWEEHNTAIQTTVGLSENVDLKQDFLLTPIPVEPIILPEILYDVAKWDLKPQFKDSLLYLYNVMVKNPTLVVELRSHTDYRDNDANNEILSQKRAQSCVDFLVNEKGIDPVRIVPKGYGEYRPRKFNNDFTYTYNGTTVRFPKGTELTEQYILTLPKNQQDVANALNRRTEFTVLRTDYVPKGDSIGAVTRPTIAVVQQRSWQVNINGEEITGNCYANDKSANFKIESGTNEIYMSYTLATQFLKDMFVTVKDFELGEQAIKQEDGSIIEGSVLYLSDFRIDDEFAENVPVIIKKNLKYNFVIGENYIKDEWGDYTIDTAKKQLIFKK